MEIEEALQTALYNRLSLAPLGVLGVHDIAPQPADSGDSSVFPYIVMGAIVLSQADTQTTLGHAAQMRIHTYSRSGSMLECKRVQGKIYAALHKQILNITDFANYSLLREDSFCENGNDGKIHGVCEYRALIESA